MQQVRSSPAAASGHRSSIETQRRKGENTTGYRNRWPYRSPPAVTDHEQSETMNAPNIRFVCPHCACNLNAPPTAAGRRVKCPGCAQPVTIPDPAEPPPELPRDSDDLPELAPLDDEPWRATAQPASEQPLDSDDLPGLAPLDDKPWRPTAKPPKPPT